MTEKREIAPLTGLRFVAALSVALAHGASILAIPGQPDSLKHWIATGAGFGMTLFFVLSGFVIHYNYRDLVTRESVDGLARFVWARFSRLYPLYILIIALDLLSPLRVAMRGIPGTFDEAAFALPYYLTLTQSWLYLTGEKFSLIYLLGNNSPLTWSISTEWFFYLVFPLFALAFLRLKRVSSILLAAGIVCAVWITAATLLYDHLPQLNTWAINRYGQIADISSGVQDSFFRWLLYFSPYLRLGEFVLGCLVAQLYLVLLDRPAAPAESRIGVAALTVGLASIPALTYLMYSPNGWLFLRKLNFNFGLAIPVAIIVFCLARYRSPVSRMMGWRPFIVLGEASYSIYLLHFFLLRQMQRFVPVGAAQQATDTILPIYFGRLALGLGVVLLAAVVSYRFIEIPARSWLRSLWRRDGALPIRNLTAVSLPLLLPAAVLIIHPHDRRNDKVTRGLQVTSATYGLNCGVPKGNATGRVQRACNGRDSCRYIVHVRVLGDPAGGCSKSFRVEYRCAPNPTMLSAEVPGEAGFGTPIGLTCDRTRARSASVP
jgi:peptidoglycan/LPS O-acetylase OafA/YrhL